jgi:hypothetical protein
VAIGDEMEALMKKRVKEREAGRRRTTKATSQSAAPPSRTHLGERRFEEGERGVEVAELGRQFHIIRPISCP